ncbi:MAG: hypothetical protein WBP58_07405 [Chitinophagaceae bacterium]
MLAEIIDKSYDLFSKYTSKQPLDICTDCCMLPEDEAKLASMPVREICRYLLAEYTNGARSEKTSIEEVKHFLPRYMELASQFDFPTHSAELTFSRLEPFLKAEWTMEELELINQFGKAYFKHCLRIYPIPSFNDSIDTILIMFWKGGFGVSDLLEVWEGETRKESVLHFRDLYFYGFEQKKKASLSNPFGDTILAGLLRDWLDSTNVKRAFSFIIEELICEDSALDENDLYDLNILYDIIRK